MQESKQEKSPTKQRILQYLGENGISMYDCYAKTGITRGVLGQNNGLSEDNLARFLAYYTEVSTEWLVLGRGSMLRDSKNPEETTIGDIPNVVPISPAEESIIYKMYKDEKEEKERMLKEKDILLKDKESKIDHLQSELRSMEKELATLKATHPQTSPPGVVIEEIHEVLGSPRIAKHVDTKPHSSTCAPSAGSVQPHQENQ